MEFCSLFSGSSGNAHFIKSGDTRILCDAGKNGKQIERALNKIGESAANLNAILITHEHSDHMAAAGVLSRRYDIPIYSDSETWERLYAQRIGKIAEHNEKLYQLRKSIYLGDLKIDPFHISHDAVNPVGFRITDGKRTMGIATDTGIITDDMDAYLNDCNLVVLESNHDLGMLETGPYPYQLKQRIRSAWGHLSNERAALYAKDLVMRGTERIILAHLSDKNNLPLLAHQQAMKVFDEYHIQNGRDVVLEVAQRNDTSYYHRF